MIEEMLAWQVVRHGRPTEALELRTVPVPTPGRGQVRVEVNATVCNYNEVDGCHGRYRTVDPPVPYTLGMELAGVIDAVGEGVDHLAVGDRVTASATGAFGAHAQRAVAEAAMTFPLPDSLDDPEGAAIFFPFHLAHLALFERGRLGAGDTVLIHAAAGGVGSAAVQLAGAAGARVIATAGGPAKVAFCRDLGADVAVDYRDDTWPDQVLAATHGRGVDVACDLVGGAITEATIALMANGGRLVMTGFSGGIESEDEAGVVPRAILFGNFSLCGVMLAYTDGPTKYGGVNLFPASTGRRVHQEVLDLVAAGRVRPVVGRVASFEDLPVELERLEARATTGRTVLDWRGS